MASVTAEKAGAGEGGCQGRRRAAVRALKRRRDRRAWVGRRPAPFVSSDMAERMKGSALPTTRRLLGALLAVAFVITAGALVVFGQIFGQRLLGGAVADGAVIFASLLAAVSCALAGQRSTGSVSAAWWLLGTSAAMWCAGQLIPAVYEGFTGNQLQFPSLANVLVLLSVAPRIAGVVFLLRNDGSSRRGGRFWLDAAIVAIALSFIAWGLGTGPVILGFGKDPLVYSFVLASPLGGVLITTVLLLGIRRATLQDRDRMLWLLTGLWIITLVDAWFAYVSINGRIEMVTDLIDVGWAAGWLMLAVAGQWPSSRATRRRSQAPIDVWQLALPWLVVLLVGVTAVALALSGQRLDSVLTILAGVLFVLLMINQVIGQREALALVTKSN